MVKHAFTPLGGRLDEGVVIAEALLLSLKEEFLVIYGYLAEDGS